MIGVGYGSYALFDGKIYKIENFSQYNSDGLTESEADFLKTVTYDKTIKIIL